MINNKKSIEKIMKQETDSVKDLLINKILAKLSGALLGITDKMEARASTPSLSYSSDPGQLLS